MSFQNGVEFRLTIDGESWTQGQKVQGRIESKPTSNAQVILVEGIDKKIKNKSADAFVTLQTISPQAAPFEWSFQLSPDAKITDKSSSLYLLYGNGDALEKYGQLKLSVLPHPHLRDLVELFSNQFRFAVKSWQSSKNGAVEIKLEPPGQKDWAMLEQLVIQLRLKSEIIEARFIFHRKEVDATRGGLSTKSIKREITRSWAEKNVILSFNQRLDKEVMDAELEKVISEYREAGWLSS